MKIIWSDFASEILSGVYCYYKDIAGGKVAAKIKSNIFNSTKQLLNHPHSGQIEESLIKLNEGHRYLVVGNYKIVYKKVSEGVLITDVFDTKQDPTKINNPKRKPSTET